MPTLRAGDEVALGTPAGQSRNDTNKDTLKISNIKFWLKMGIYTNLYLENK